MAKPKNSRKARFLASLRLAGMTMAEWAEQNGTAQGYVSSLIGGKRSNEALDRKIDAFIDKYLKQVA